MNDKTLSIIFREEVEFDLLSPSVTINYFDLLEKKPVEKTVTYPLIYNAVRKGETVPPREKAVRYLMEHLHEDGYTLYKPFQGNIECDLLAGKDGEYLLFIFVLDSESERKLWPVDRIEGEYRIFVIRDRGTEERKGVTALTLDEAFDSFNFSSR